MGKILKEPKKEMKYVIEIHNLHLIAILLLTTKPFIRLPCLVLFTWIRSLSVASILPIYNHPVVTTTLQKRLVTLIPSFEIHNYVHEWESDPQYLKVSITTMPQ